MEYKVLSTEYHVRVPRTFTLLLSPLPGLQNLAPGTHHT